jgi:glutathione-independent formaldehyde dehydrogenase
VQPRTICRFEGWSKSPHFHTGRAPVPYYNRQSMMTIPHDHLQISKVGNAALILLEEAPVRYHEFDKGAARKYVIGAKGLLGKRAA